VAGGGVTPKMREALRMLVEQETHGYRNGEGAVSAWASGLFDGQAWIHFRTVRALERADLIEVRWGIDGSDIWLRDAGREAVAA
jgi:hypothetical protein